MAQVPQYNPTPTVAPQQQGLPSIHVDSPVAAFGGASAAAETKLGSTLEGVGNELFARAQALQQLKNETEAKDADVSFMIAAGEVHAKYNELQGQARVDAFPKYSSDLQALYRTHRGNLSNPMSQRMFDSSAVSTLSRSIFNGAGAAATAQREAALTSVASQETLLEKQQFDGGDETSFNQAILDIKSNAPKKAALMAGGSSPERVALITQQGISNLAYNRIIGMARNEPYKASQMLEEYKSKGYLFGPQLIEATNKVQSFTESVGTDIISSRVMAQYRLPDGTFSKSAGEMRDEAVQKATEAYPNDPKIGTATQAAFDRNFNQHNWATHQDALAVNQQLNEYVVKGAQTVDQLPKNLVDRMTPAQIKAYPAQANTYKRSIDTQTNQDKYEKLLGLYNNDNAKFMDTNLLQEEGLSKSNINFFLKLQRQASPNGDSRVSRAMNQLKGAAPGTLTDLGIIGKNKDPDIANKFTGALHEALQSWQEERGKPPTERELVKEIFPSLMMRTTEPEGFLGRILNYPIGGIRNDNQLFQADLPDMEKAKSAAEFDAKRPLSDEEVRQTVLREHFKKLFAKPPASKDQSQVGK